MRFFVEVNIAWKAKNKACKEMQEYAKTVNRMLIYEADLPKLIQNFQDKTNEINLLFHRCSDLLMKVNNYNDPDVLIFITPNVATIVIKQIKQQWPGK